MVEDKRLVEVYVSNMTLAESVEKLLTNALLFGDEVGLSAMVSLGESIDRLGLVSELKVSR